MPKFQVTVANENGHKLYDEIFEASGLRKVCEIATRDSETVDIPDDTTGPVETGAYMPGAGAHPFRFGDGGVPGSKTEALDKSALDARSVSLSKP